MKKFLGLCVAVVLLFFVVSCESDCVAGQNDEGCGIQSQAATDGEIPWESAEEGTNALFGTMSGGVVAGATDLSSAVHRIEVPGEDWQVRTGDNIPPVANAGEDQNVIEWQIVTLDASASYDPDNGPSTPVTYQWEQTGGTAVTLNNPTTAHPTFKAPLVPPIGETLSFRVTVRDGDPEFSPSDIVAINVNLRPTQTVGFTETWESGDFAAYWVPESSTQYGQNLIADNTYLPTHGGTHHLIQNSTSGYARNEVILFANLNALDYVYLDFWHKRYNNDSMHNITTSPFSYSQNYDGVSISNNGINWYRVTPNPWTAYTSYTKNSYRLDTISGISMTSKVLIKFQWYDYYNYSSYTYGYGWDDIELYRNRAPTADAGEYQTVNEGAAVTLHGEGSSDPDTGDTLTYSWVKTVGPNNITLAGADTANPTFTAPSPIWENVTYTFRLRVTDKRGLYHEDTVNVTVTDNVPNTKPVVNAGEDVNAVEWEYVTLTAVASDEDGGPNATLSYSWVQDSGPTVQNLTGTTTNSITFRTPVVTAGGQTAVFTVTVSDGVSADNASDSVNVVIAERTRTNIGLNETWESGDFAAYWVPESSTQY
ncbi:MAG TPA: PKD domain-containing protein, partial [bacterium]|nr:PKD domain-containing protein [bacterium]